MIPKAAELVWNISECMRADISIRRRRRLAAPVVSNSKNHYLCEWQEKRLLIRQAQDSVSVVLPALGMMA
ncbi:hypothetical protein KCP78_21690 [Salmonella enterica subsp. enterica]|nr:hypothetical protein KCP78_21690 [Salmonella enterica subsp. enterica]